MSNLLIQTPEAKGLLSSKKLRIKGYVVWIGTPDSGYDASNVLRIGIDYECQPEIRHYYIKNKDS